MKTETTDKIYGIALALTFGLAATVQAQGDFHVAAGNGIVDEYGLDQSTVDPSLFSGHAMATRIALSGKNLFVLNGDDTIGKYTLSGTTINPITIAASGNYLFVANSDGTISEYTTSGEPVNISLIFGVGPAAIATSGSDPFAADSPGTVGGYTASGTTAKASLISGLGQPTSIAISGNNLFVANGDGTVGDTTSGAPIASSSIGSGYLNGIISENDLFFMMAYGGIGVGSPSGGTANSSLISGLGGPYGMATLENGQFVANAGGATDETPAADSVSAPLISGPAVGLAKHAPEPSSIALAGLSAAMLWLWRWRRRDY